MTSGTGATSEFATPHHNAPPRTGHGRVGYRPRSVEADDADATLETGWAHLRTKMAARHDRDGVRPKGFDPFRSPKRPAGGPRQSVAVG